jgi:glycosyltransferase involved in cell wall biosynthesis
VLSPLTLPLPGVPAADRLNAALLSARLRRACRRLGITRPMLWTFMPNVGGLLGRVDERLVIYHCVDEYAAFTGVPREAIERMERDLVRRADLVFASSSLLAAERKRINPHTYLVRHGVDVDHFAKALDPATTVPAELAALPRPVIGFFGLIADWVDVDLIATLAASHPRWSFVLVGGIAASVEALRGLRNVRLLGRQPYAALPAYCRGFDVGIVPFRTNALTIRANPLKLREYLAAGLPVVATPLPEVVRYAALVRLARQAESFGAAIESSLTENDPARRGRRVDAMRAESWASRVDEMTGLIAAHERRPAPGAALGVSA